LNVTTVTNRQRRRIIAKPPQQKFWSEGLQTGFSGVYGKDTPIFAPHRIGEHWVIHHLDICRFLGYILIEISNQFHFE